MDHRTQQCDTAVTSSSRSAKAGSQEASIEVAALFFTGLNDSKPIAIDFSVDGLHFISAHGDDAVRVVDTEGLAHTDTIQCDDFGVHTVRFTQSSNVACIAPRYPLDGHLHLLNLETAQFFGEMAYLNDYEGELKPVTNMPVYSCVAQCPRTDVLSAIVASEGRLALFHPLIAGAIACTPAHTIQGSYKSCTSFGCDGNYIIVGDDATVRLYDRRMLFKAAVQEVSTIDVFARSSPATPNRASSSSSSTSSGISNHMTSSNDSHSGNIKRAGAAALRCKGAEVCVNSQYSLLTSACGEVVIYNWSSRSVEVNYYHDDARRHFVGSSDAIGAQYVNPSAADSVIAQPTSSMVGGRHLLVYDGLHNASSPAPSSMGSLLYELQSKDSDVPVGLAINRRFRLLAVAARTVTWWSLTV